MLNKHFKLIPFLILPFITAVLVFSTETVFAQINQSKTYIVQLNSSESEALKSVGHNIQPEFNFALNQKFENIFTFQSDLSLSELQIRLDGKLKYIEEDKEVSIGQNEISRLPNDPGVTTNGANIDKQWGLVKAEFTRAWRTTTGSEDVVVAVIDTGIDATHEDFRNTKFVGGYDVITDSVLRSKANSDDNGHGTLVAGVIAATGNNSIGIAGASYNTSLMAVKALNSRGSGTSSRISQAIVWATDNGADV
ncbi:MAG TPA: S8 family serine peptidase, partial [Candidatus Doudnabacteria bacterium]|nr:S8 family serine peptidase [Candidatus Doudnabacteria bacterium]